MKSDDLRQERLNIMEEIKNTPVSYTKERLALWNEMERLDNLIDQADKEEDTQ